MRRFGALAVVVGNGALLVATSPPRAGVSRTAPLPEVVALDPSTPDLELAVDYTFRPDSDSPRATPTVTIELNGDSLSGATGELQLLALDDAGDWDLLDAVPVDAGLGAPLAVQLAVSGPVALARGDGTLTLLLHLDGDAELVADGRLTLSIALTQSSSDAELRLREIR